MVENVGTEGEPDCSYSKEEGIYVKLDPWIYWLEFLVGWVASMASLRCPVVWRDAQYPTNVSSYGVMSY